MIHVRQTRSLALVASFGVLLACRPASESRREAQERRAATRADEFLQRVSSGTPYQRVCTTRLRDGYVFTFRLRPNPNVGYNDIDPWPIIALHDSGSPRVLPRVNLRVRELKTDPGAPSPPVPDSARLAAIVREVVPTTAQNHCVLPMADGALVQFIPRD